MCFIQDDLQWLGSKQVGHSVSSSNRRGEIKKDWPF
jgi:hypothetical protein